MSRLARDQPQQMQAICIPRVNRKDLPAKLLGLGEATSLKMCQRLSTQVLSRT